MKKTRAMLNTGMTAQRMPMMSFRALFLTAPILLLFLALMDGVMRRQP
jgi:hypothetical protein